MVDKIGYSRPAGPASRTSATKRASSVQGAQFVEALNKAEGIEAASDIESVQTVAALTGVGGLIGAQEVSDEEIHRRRATKRGRLTLDALEQLRDGLLMGTVSVSTIHALEKLVAEQRAHAALDPRLAEVLDEIELRAAVELAKLEVAQSRR